MQITTWNVNGLRALIRKEAWDWVVQESPEIICLQETKAQADQLIVHLDTLAPYTWTWASAEKKGYSGVGTGLQGVAADAATTIGFGHEEFDREGRVVQSDHTDFILFNIYFPNGSRDHSRVPYKLDFYARLLDLCDELHAAGKKVILTGDFNTSHREIDLAHPGPNSKKTGFLPEEREWLDKYIEHGLVDAWRALYPDRVQYTWWSLVTRARERNVGWRLDFFMVSEALMSSVEDVVIHDEVPGSDHCPVSLILK